MSWYRSLPDGVGAATAPVVEPDNISRRALLGAYDDLRSAGMGETHPAARSDEEQVLLSLRSLIMS